MSYQAADIERICKIKRLRLHTWVAEGWITPSVQKASGHGTRNIWSRTDLYKIMLLKRLIENGFHRKAAAGILGNYHFDGIRKLNEDEKKLSPVGSLWLVICRRWNGDEEKGIRSFPYPFLGVRNSESYKVSALDVLLGNMRHGDFNWDDTVIINLSKLIEDTDANL